VRRPELLEKVEGGPPGWRVAGREKLESRQQWRPLCPPTRCSVDVLAESLLFVGKRFPFRLEAAVFADDGGAGPGTAEGGVADTGTKVQILAPDWRHRDRLHPHGPALNEAIAAAVGRRELEFRVSNPKAVG
jgi:hypothetical protein